MTGKLSKQRRYDARWLPPLSLPSVVGVVLFVTYVGSAMWSSLPEDIKEKTNVAGGIRAPFTQEKATPSWNTRVLNAPSVDGGAVAGRGEQAGPRDLSAEEVYEGVEEAEFCNRVKNIEFDSCFRPSRPTNKTIYMLPYGGLGNRLRGTASALSLAKQKDANVVIVWTEKEWGFRGAWSELFDAPKIPIGCFPGDVVREEFAECKVHLVNNKHEWNAVKNEFEKRPDGSEVLCLRSMMFLTGKQRDISWFLKLLRPSEVIVKAINEFKAAVKWNEWGSWIGMHIRRSDLRLKCNDLDCESGLFAAETLSLDRYIDLIKKIVHLKSKDSPRVFIATDDAAAEAEVKNKLAKQLDLSTDNYSVVSYKKSVRDASSSAYEMRSNVDGTKEAVIDLWLLSETPVLIGTTGSTYSQAARLIGNHFFTAVGVEFENKLD